MEGESGSFVTAGAPTEDLGLLVRGALELLLGALTLTADAEEDGITDLENDGPVAKNDD